MGILKRRNRASKGPGTMTIIIGLFVTSALVRVGAEVGPVMAEARSGIEVPAEPAVAEPTGAGAPSHEELDTMLRAFEAREKRIREQEVQIEARMKALSQADKKIEERLVELKTAEEELRATLALASTAAEDDLTRLTAVYENMKPKTAAALFQEMAPEFAAGFLGRMRPDSAAAVMAGMTPDAAYRVSAILAGRNANVPKN